MRHLLLLIFILIQSAVFAQVIEGNLDLKNPDQKHVLLTKDQNRYIGHIIRMNRDSILIDIGSAVPLFVPSQQVAKILVYETEVKFKKGKESDFLNTKHLEQSMIGHEKYFVSNSAFTLKKGDLAYRNIDIFYNSLSYGVNDYWTIGGSLYPFGLHTKLGLEIIPKVQGAIYSDLQVFEASRAFANFGAAGTIGTAENNISLSWTLAFAGFNQDFDENYQILSLASSIHLFKRIGLIAEVNLMTDTGGYYNDTFDLYSVGISYLSKNQRWVFGGNFVHFEEAFVNYFTLPYVSFFTHI